MKGTILFASDIGSQAVHERRHQEPPKLPMRANPGKSNKDDSWRVGMAQLPESPKRMAVDPVKMGILSGIEGKPAKLYESGSPRRAENTSERPNPWKYPKSPRTMTQRASASQIQSNGKSKPSGSRTPAPRRDRDDTKRAPSRSESFRRRRPSRTPRPTPKERKQLASPLHRPLPRPRTPSPLAFRRTSPLHPRRRRPPPSRATSSR